MTKKDKDFVKEFQTAQQQGNFKPSQIKKSRSAEDLKPPSKSNPETQEKDAQIAVLTEQITRIKQETNQSLQSKDREIKELTTEKNKLADQNSELRINNLKQDNYFTKYQSESKLNQQLKLQISRLQKDLTITQQDLKSAQRIIELRTIKPDAKHEENFFDY